MNSFVAERHRLVARPSLGPVIFPAERDAMLIQGDESLVGNRHPVGIAGQIRQHCCGSGKRALGIDHPLDLAQRCQPVGEDDRIGQIGVLPEELQLAAAVCLGKFFQEAPPKQP